MLEPKNIKVTSEAIDRLVITWEIMDTVEEIHDYLFSIYRSQSPGGPWDMLVDGIEDRYRYEDGGADVRHRWRQFHYRLDVKRKSDSQVLTGRPVTLEAPVDLIAAEVRRRENMLFQQKTGRRSLLFPIRTFGQKCHCWDSVLQKKLVDRCLNCFGVGYVGGYMRPILTYAQIYPAIRSNQQLRDAETQQASTKARMLAFPVVKPKDVVVEAENRRWRIVEVPRTEKLRAVLHQQPLLSEIHPGDIEFELPVDWTTLEVPAEIRNFRRLSTL